MIRKIACAVFILGVSFSLALGEEFRATIKKVEDGKITFVKRDENKKEVGDAMTLPVADKVKVVNLKFTKDMKVEAGDEIKDGLKNEMFKKIGEKGLIGRIITDDDGKKITEIRVFQFGGKKKKDAN